MWLYVIGRHVLSTKRKHNGNAFGCEFTPAKQVGAPVETLAGEIWGVTGPGLCARSCAGLKALIRRAWRLDGTVRTGSREHSLDVGCGLAGAVDDPRVGVLLRRHDALEVRAEHDDDELRRAGRGRTHLDALGLLRDLRNQRGRHHRRSLRVLRAAQPDR